MLALKSLVRWTYALAAMFLFPIAIIVLVRLPHAATPMRSWRILAELLTVAILSAKAFWSTRKPSAKRNLWAMAASYVYLDGGLLVLAVSHHRSLANPELLLVAAGAAGLAVFARKSKTPAPVVAAAATTKPARIPGDRTSLWIDRLASIIFMIAAWQILAAWYPWARGHNLHTYVGLPMLGLIAVVALVTAVLHECGHAMAARAFGMKVLGFSAGPFQWRKQEGKWKLSFKSSGFLGGTVHVLPTHPDEPAWHRRVHGRCRSSGQSGDRPHLSVGGPPRPGSSLAAGLVLPRPDGFVLAPRRRLQPGAPALRHWILLRRSAHPPVPHQQPGR